ncbi:hypothetical protein N2152v2_001501 [Parachlorella kessleri]
MTAANKTAFSILAALEGQEDVDEATIEDLPEDEEAHKRREAKELARQKKAMAKKHLKRGRYLLLPGVSSADTATVIVRLCDNCSQAQAKQQLEQHRKQEALKAKQQQSPPPTNLPFDLIKRTQMCNDWLETGRCKRGADCLFAHDFQEMQANRARVRQYKAEQQQKQGYPPHTISSAAPPSPPPPPPSAAAAGAGPSSTGYYGAAAGAGASHPKGFMHPVFQRGGSLYKTRLCRNFMAGTCTYGSHCTFAHGEKELREHVHDQAALEWELSRWGLQGAGGSHTSNRQQQQPGRGRAEELSGHSEDYSYIDSLYHESYAATDQQLAEQEGSNAGQGSFHQWQGYGQGPANSPTAPQQAQQGGELGAKQMDDAQLAQLMHGLDFTEEEEHPAFVCPITHEIMQDPVVAADGYSYDRHAIEAWLATRSTSPMTNEELEDKASATGAGSSESEPVPEGPRPRQPQTVSVPYGVPTAGRVFLFAGLLKLWMMCLPFTPMASFMYVSGRVDLGFWAVLKMLPISLGLAALAKFIVDRKLHERSRVRWAVVIGSVAALALSRLLFYSPGHNPKHILAPRVRAQQEAYIAHMRAGEEEVKQRQLARERALKSPQDAKEFLRAREQMMRALEQGPERPPQRG